MPPDLPDRPLPPALALTRAELDRLEEALDAAPPPLQPPVLEMLDGFLCGVIVQPRVVAHDEWLPWALDVEGRSPPEAAAWRARVEPLVRRRHAQLGEAIEMEAGFDPFIFGFDDEHPPQLSEYEPLAGLPPVSQALAPWLAGFFSAEQRYGGLATLDGALVAAPWNRLRRHMPVPGAAALPIAPGSDPNEGLDAAIDELVGAVVELHDLGDERRWHVETIRREAPKVGRNDPCPCGSGRKYKRCHGAG